jgi:hypothetical protein
VRRRTAGFGPLAAQLTLSGTQAGVSIGEVDRQARDEEQAPGGARTDGAPLLHP